jgi:hypothetical protein
MGKMKKKEITMNRSKALGRIILILVAFLFLSSDPRSAASDLLILIPLTVMISQVRPAKRLSRFMFLLTF